MRIPASVLLLLTALPLRITAQVPASAANVRITEVNYHPHDLTAAELASPNAPVDPDGFEFIEIRNLTANLVTLENCVITGGIDIVTFDATAELDPNESAVLVRDTLAFQLRYGTGPQILYDYNGKGKLSDGGEPLALFAANGALIQSFTYNDAGGWPSRADGFGTTLEAIDLNGDFNNPDNWRSSREYGGSPGAVGTGPLVTVVINEVLNHSDPPLKDFIELRNMTGTAINIGNWILTDDLIGSNITRYRIPAATILPANGFLTFDTDDFLLFDSLNPLGLSEYGEALYLLEATATKPLAFVDDVKFEATDVNVSQGRVINSVGNKDFVILSSITQSAANSGALIGPLAITEIMYNPGTNELEFVELLNISNATVPLWDATSPATNRYWRLGEAVSYQFTTGDQLLAGEYALVCQTNPPIFRARYDIPAHVKIFGPYSGSLSNGGETLRLWRPGTYDLVVLGNTTVQVEKVEYDDISPWPLEADGLGPALEREIASAYANDPANWSAYNSLGSPGGPRQLDSDADGLPDNLEYALFRTLATNNFPTSDRDADGLRDLDEYALGTPLTSPGVPLEIQIGPQPAGGVQLSFPTIPAAGPGYYGLTRTYTVEAALDLPAGSWTNQTGMITLTATGPEIVLPIALPVTNGVFRVRALVE